MNKNVELFDERQTLIRYKYGTHSFIISIFLLVINIVIKATHGNWATPLTESFSIIAISLFYFIIRTILDDSYLSNNKKLKLLIISDFFIVSILLTVFLIINKVSMLSNGILTDSFSILFLDILCFSTGIVSLIICHKSAKNSD